MKVAEGSYGEVFKLEKRDIPLWRAAKATKQDPDAYGGCIFKLIPLRAKSSKSNKQTSLDALVREVQMLKRMDPIPGFARFRDITVLEGPYPLSFTEAYNDHRALRPSDSHNTLPSRYSQKQLWAMIEMDDGGRDLEILRTPSAYQIFDIFWTTCCALSYAEEHVEFEVRISQRSPSNALANMSSLPAPRPPHGQHLHQTHPPQPRS
jgi:serine/threonine-protein kinase haspin